MLDPVVTTIVASMAGLILLSVVLRSRQRRREAAEDAARREELLRQRGQMQIQQQEVERLAGRIIATSSRASIAGFALRRQIEAIITDGHATPAKAVEMLKALAAQKGANAIINLVSDRATAGKCSARGDAVIVSALESRFRSASAPPETSPEASTPPPSSPPTPPRPPQQPRG